MKKTTEERSHYDHLETKPIEELLIAINTEDQKVAQAVKTVLPNIETVIKAILPRMQVGGKLFYIGAGTSGRLGVVDASECPPTFGVDFDLVNGIIAGGDSAIRKAVEFAEDDENQGFIDLKAAGLTSLDAVVGITASGSTPYVLGALKQCNELNVYTAGITCNHGSNLAKVAQNCIDCVVGPEFITGSTRMKAGTAQKMILNMISTTLMIKLGRVKGNKMVDMQLTNTKLIERGINMICEITGLSPQEAEQLLIKSGSVRKAIASIQV